MPKLAAAKIRKEIQEFKQECLKYRGNYKLVSPRYHPRVALCGWMELEGYKQDRLAKHLGTVGATVSAWINGTTRPSLLHREALLTLCSIPTASWDLPFG